MTNVKSTKRALVSSILALFLCFAMLLGTTYAWFTDSVSSDNNIIKTGTLDVIMEYADGGKSPEGATWNDASKEAIFEHDNWEPGYASAKHIKVSNVGTLALNYQMRIVANGVVSKLADVIDVYYIRTSDKAITRDMLATAVEADKVSDDTNIIKVGTLTEVLGATYNLSKYAVGSLEVGESYVHAIVLKMQETADNEYQNMDLGCTFSVQLIATQKSSEKDSFDDQYDKVDNVPDPSIPAALVRPLYDLKIDTTGSKMGADLGEIDLDCGFQFEPTMLLTDAEKSEYRYWHADFVVKADKDVPAKSMALAGYYDAWCSLNNDKWVALTAEDVIPAGTEIRLVQSMGNGGITVNWEELCEYGNDGIGFRCGAVDLTGENRGTTMTVELRIYETTKAWDADSGTANEETGEFITVGKFEHTFGGNYVTLEDNTVLFYADDGEVVLYDISDVETDNYYVPVGVTTLNSGVFAQNADIKTVNVSKTVTDFGATGVSETNASSGAFKGSAVETVVLPEGMTEIPAAAFNGAKNLKSVNIPASVETIGVNAFRQTALETLKVPATVKTISYGAFRDMDSLTTVTIEGDVHIPNYAFRDCSALRTVYINGENATVGSNMAFANASSNNPGTNNIKFYVKNSTVASQVEACMGVGTDYWIFVDGQEVDVENVNDATKLQDVLANAGADDVICLTNDVTVNGALSNSYGSTALNMFGGVFDGNGHTIDATNCGGTWDSAINVTGGTIKNVVVNSGFRGIFVNHNGTGAKVYLENVIINGPTYTISCDQGTNNGLEAVNSTFNGWTSYAATIGDVKFTDCYFGEGAGYAFFRPYAKTVFVNCEFEEGYRMDPRAAVEFVNCTYAGEPLTVDNIASLVYQNIDKVTLDGAKFVTTADTLKALLTSDKEEITVILGDDISIDISTGLQLGGANTKSITIDGNGNTLTLSNTYRSYFNLANAEGVLNLKNMTLTNLHKGTHFFDYTTHFNCDVVAENVVFTKSPLVTGGATATFTDCEFVQEGSDIYGLWIMSGSNVTVNGGVVNTDRGFKIADEDSAEEATTLKVSGTDFNNTEKAAILVTTAYGATITVDNVDISDCANDSTNAVWLDEDRTDYASKVTVTGATIVNEP